MLKKVEKEIKICDSCESDDCVFNECNACGKHFCYNCNKEKQVGKTFSHSVYCSGGDDVYFCTSCINNPVPRTIQILAAYQQISLLRAESKSWYNAFEKRTKEAEANIKIVVKKYNI